MKLLKLTFIRENQYKQEFIAEYQQADYNGIIFNVYGDIEVVRNRYDNRWLYGTIEDDNLGTNIDDNGDLERFYKVMTRKRKIKKIYEIDENLG